VTRCSPLPLVSIYKEGGDGCLYFISLVRLDITSRSSNLYNKVFKTVVKSLYVSIPLIESLLLAYSFYNDPSIVTPQLFGLSQHDKT
jgi:hypothetical protein